MEFVARYLPVSKVFINIDAHSITSPNARDGSLPAIMFKSYIPTSAKTHPMLHENAVDCVHRKTWK